MRKKKAAVVGLNFGTWVIENELLSGAGKDYFTLAAVCDRDREKADAVAERFHVPACYDLDVLLRNREIEAVVLVTGPSGRAKLIHRILDAGKPVMTTKPFETSSREALEVLKRAQRLGLPVFMNSPTPVAEEEIRQIEAWTADYGLGRLIGYRADTYCSYREKADGSWYDDISLCPAAPITRLGIYLLNDLCRLAAPVRDVQVFSSRIFTGRPTADNAQLSVLHEDGCIGSVYASFCIEDLQYYRCSMELHYERGSVYKNIGPMRSGDIELEMCANAGGGRKHEACRIKKEGAGYQWKNFYRAIEGEEIGTVITPEQVTSSIRILELMREKCAAWETAGI